MISIDVDFEVFKALTNRRDSETVSYNDVLREILGLPKAAGPQTNGGGNGGWTWKGLYLPNGTQLRGEFNDQVHWATIEDGKWMQDGVQRRSPSRAASDITQGAVNGWLFWSVKRPCDLTWVKLHELRSKPKAAA